jgi:hypothetical protein
LFASAAPEVKMGKEYRGAYLGPGGKLIKASKIAQDPELAKKLWAVSEQTVAEILKI